ncbi:ECF transporter S component [Enterococcus dongliensis]|uniref:ECF transporter S component n=1 Tax=Enterococcus dongliensis TaxID=2559925 RepID=A0AAP5KPH4_9ENTE|nr:ECF transporter S component [Enterococcus dongliensis]MDT2595962.1 ECF transporter S component [Enterococcus dongliensis]MDT2603384.1 ECF transporter S component [Enterococcus dongliensis]MDT2634300.1 ECF transporter S component [Enterococcus dongliensis]MDT2636817.1 ECF transporter S component [Enterococcus dongliensis]MDT2639315.1 ECF transporter S component [Enterococcus dongliensis]
MKENNVRGFTLTAMFLAIMIILAVTPLGFIPIGPINATTMHIPVIIASIVLGPRIGAGLGTIFGVISLARSTILITPMSFVFSPFIANPLTNQGDWRAVLIAIIPRVLIGVVPYFVYRGLHHLMKQKARPISLFIAGVAGSMTNTILVMNLIFLFFKDSYANVLQVTADAVYGVILGIIFGSGLVEAVVAGIATMGVCAVLLRLMKK